MGGLVLAAIILFAVNIAANSLLTTSRVDLTENQLYTLTQGTKNILAKLDEPVTLRLFLSQEQITKFPGVADYARRVVELLREYERRAAGKLKLRIIDPEPFSDEEDRAVAYGLRGVALDDGASVLYFGLVGTGATDEQEVI
ncbi:MAG: GldG family protein, partial [Gammaproteobacteria bacterium]|nr:GldG family protein [Gammaproteobacteria bacterium]